MTYPGVSYGTPDDLRAQIEEALLYAMSSARATADQANKRADDMHLGGWADMDVIRYDSIHTYINKLLYDWERVKNPPTNYGLGGNQ